jgi:hypothetical protein
MLWGAAESLNSREDEAVKQSWSIEEVSNALLMGEEIALVDLRTEAAFASGHPLSASQFTLNGLQAEEAPGCCTGGEAERP